MIIKINAPLGFYEIGARAKQEDAIYPQLSMLSQQSQVIVLCDGLSGYSLGDVASTTVANAIGQWIESNTTASSLNEEMVRCAIAQAQEKLNEVSIAHNNTSSMGTTMAMLAMGESGMIAAHIGNTRIYHVRPDKGVILYRSRNHSLLNDLFVKGKLTREEVESSSMKNVLTRAMMPNVASTPDLALITDIEQGDYFFICTEGVTEKLSDKQLLEVLTRTDMIDQAKIAELQMLVKDSKNNRSAVLIRVDKVAHQEGENLFVSNEKAMCDKMVHVGAIAAAASVAQSAVSEPAVTVEPENSPLPPEVPAVPEEPTSLPPEVPEVPSEPTSSALEVLPPEAPAEEPVATTAAKSNGLKKFLDSRTKIQKALMLAGLILLASILLALGIYSLFNRSTTNSDNKSSQQQVQGVDTLPDVSIDSLLPEMPTDSLPVGSNIDVPRAPGISGVSLPSTTTDKEIGASLPNDKKSSSGRYDTGSNVHVPRAPRYNGDNTPPYDPYDGTGGFGSDEPISDDDDDFVPEEKSKPTATEEPKPIEPEVKETKPSPQATQATPPVRKTDQLGNAKGAVPPPPSRKRNIEIP